MFGCLSGCYRCVFLSSRLSVRHGILNISGMIDAIKPQFGRSLVYATNGPDQRGEDTSKRCQDDAEPPVFDQEWIRRL